MVEDAHTDDLRNVNEGDSVTIKTTTGERYTEVECTYKQVSNADPRTGEIRKTHLWVFNADGRDLTAAVIDGLKSSPDDPDFPVHKKVSLSTGDGDSDWDSVGYIETVEIHGPRLES